MDTKFVPVSEAKGRLSEIVRAAEDHDVTLMRHGRPAAIVISPGRLEALVERLEDAEDRLSIHEREGVTVDFDKLMNELGVNEE